MSGEKVAGVRKLTEVLEAGTVVVPVVRMKEMTVAVEAEAERIYGLEARHCPIGLWLPEAVEAAREVQEEVVTEEVPAEDTDNVIRLQRPRSQVRKVMVMLWGKEEMALMVVEVMQEPEVAEAATMEVMEQGKALKVLVMLNRELAEVAAPDTLIPVFSVILPCLMAREAETVKLRLHG